MKYAWAYQVFIRATKAKVSGCVLLLIRRLNARSLKIPDSALQSIGKLTQWLTSVHFTYLSSFPSEIEVELESVDDFAEQCTSESFEGRFKGGSPKGFTTGP